jgi:CheY-like chemotaxis protein
MKLILVIDDEPSIATMLQAVLEDEGYRVMIARNGRDGLARLQENRPELVLCDIMMPVLDGPGLIQAMQSNPAHRDIPVVLMSAVDRSINSVRSQCAAFIQKPFQLDQLLDTVASLIGYP